MNQKDILNALGDIDPALIPALPVKKKKTRKPLAAIAACLTLIVAGTLGLTRPWQLRKVDLGGVTRLYRNTSSQTESGSLIFPWEYRPIWDQFTSLTRNDRSYRSRAKSISPELLGESLGMGTASGYDIYTETTPQQDFPVYAIRGIDPELLIAVELDGVYWVYMQDDYAPPATLGEFLAGYQLAENITLTSFSLSEDYSSQGYYRLTDGDLPIWELLESCREAAYLELDPFHPQAKSLIFSATSEALGIYKKSFRISSDGYLDTNIAEYGYAFYIGEEVANAIIDYALSNSQTAELEPYCYYLSGTVTEIGEDYFLLDDSLLAAGKGMRFKVPTEDLLIRRWLEFGGIGVGDFITVTYYGGIEDGTVIGAYSLSRSYLADGHVLIPE